MSLNTTDTLRDVLMGSYEDPDRAFSKPNPQDLTQMLGDMMRRMADLNAQAQLRAFQRTYDGQTDREELQDSLKVSFQGRLVGGEPHLTLRTPMGRAAAAKLRKKGCC